MRTLVLSLAVSACGANVRVTDDDGAGGADVADPLAGAGVGGDSGFSVWPGQTFSTINCSEDGAELFVEIWPDNAATDACLPAANIDPSQVLVIVIDSWDLTPGLFAMEWTTEHGTAHAAYASGPENASGSITLEPFADTPGIISWDLDFAEGSTDLSLCFVPPTEPCASPL